MPFAKYGSWKKTHPEIACGLKRGFSFFNHAQGQPFRPSVAHENELLVAANPSAELGDTHWFRADFDAHMAEQAQSAGVCYLDRCEGSTIEHGGEWHITGITPDEAVEVTGAFIVDATGEGAALPRALGIEQSSGEFATSSRGLYGHFTNVTPWSELLTDQGPR